MTQSQIAPTTQSQIGPMSQTARIGLTSPIVQTYRIARMSRTDPNPFPTRRPIATLVRQRRLAGMRLLRIKENGMLSSSRMTCLSEA
jgi:hypothetical protein